MNHALAAVLVLVVAGLVVVAMVVIGALIAGDGGTGHEYWESHLDELDDMFADDDEPDEESGRRSLAPGWPEQVTPPPVPQLTPTQPTTLYFGRHADDTIEWHKVPAGWWPSVGAARISAALDATEQWTVTT